MSYHQHNLIKPQNIGVFCGLPRVNNVLFLTRCDSRTHNSTQNHKVPFVSHVNSGPKPCFIYLFIIWRWWSNYWMLLIFSTKRTYGMSDAKMPSSDLTCVNHIKIEASMYKMKPSMKLFIEGRSNTEAELVSALTPKSSSHKGHPKWTSTLFVNCVRLITTLKNSSTSCNNNIKAI